ncbi:DC-STAMP domain-containing protein 2 [Megalops cyprinoides]|uniref:DC-STAMP domain-containing protein 2 n=1 Tax=Megalops cyprinoides TaxID=118141 RepID=UPI00186565D3|nr:DC-STAMP domain-containing protein 2 [Megalops cyprinoides]
MRSDKIYKPLEKGRRRRNSDKLRDSPLVEAARSLCWFMFGLFLATVYGGTALFLQNYGLWYCLTTTVIIAGFIAFGMGLSIRVRSNVMLMLPMLCSRKGKNVLLFLIFSLVVQGPMANTLENFDRAAGSVACGAELAMNQTHQLMERAAAPLLPVLNKIKLITRNAYTMAGRVQNLIKALTESVRHIARSLRNVLHFLVNIGEVCNDKMSTPYRKCNNVFDEARDNCMELLSIFSFLCHVVEGFRPLCGLAHVVQLFCIIPEYIASHMKTRVAASTIAAFEQLRQEFDFNISASIHFDTQLNSSQSVQQVAQGIMGEVTADLTRVQELMGLLGYVGLFLLLLMYLQAILYKNKFLYQDDFDNIYITEQFMELDLERSRKGKPTLLPLSHKEALVYIQPYSLSLTAKEKRAAALSAVSILRHIVVGCLVVALDLMVFWIFDVVHHLAQGEIVARAPIVVAVQVNGSGYASDIFKDLVASFDILQKGNITVLSKKCLMEPSEPDYNGYIIIGVLYGLSFFVVMAGSYCNRIRRFICASYYPKRERERILFLYNRILTQRASLRKALLRSVARSKADEAHPSLRQKLAALLPAGSCIAKLLKASEVSCMACGKVAKGREDPDVFVCSTPQCKGLLCHQCLHSMDGVCTICMGPLTFQEDSEEELDSSDDKQVGLWTAALKNMKHSCQSSNRKKLLKRRIREALRRRPGARDGKSQQGSSERTRMQDIGVAGGSDTSSNISTQSETDHSDPDMAYQNQPAWDHSGSSDHDPQPFLDVFVRQEQGVQMDVSDSSSSYKSSIFQEAELHTITVENSIQKSPPS